MTFQSYISFLVLILAVFSLKAEEKSLPAPLPLKEVFLYSSGVGAFFHEGKISGEKEFSFRFRDKQLNDVLKSLFITGTKGVKFRNASYSAKLPLSSLMEDFRIPAADIRSFSDLLRNMQGEEFTGNLLDGSSFSGLLISVEEKTTRIPSQNTVIKKEFISLLTPTGFRRIALEDVKEIRPTAENLAEMQKAMKLLAGMRNKDAKDLKITVQAPANSTIGACYVIESPVWKSSYRLQLPGKSGEKGILQAWALVENPTSSNWKDVKLHLMSGEPVSFVQDLYTSYTPARSVIPLPGREKKAANPVSPMAVYSQDRSQVAFLRKSRSRSNSIEAHQDIVSASGNAGINPESRKEGALFRYTLPGKVTLEGRKNAMLELFSEKLAAEEFTLISPEKEKPCSLAVYFVNTTPFLFPAGPLTIYNGSSYGGDAQIPDLPSGKSVLLPFAKDLEVKVDKSSQIPGKAQILDAKLVNGLLTIRKKEVREITYKLENFSRKEKKNLLLEYRKTPGTTLFPAPPEKVYGEGKNIIRYVICLAPGSKKDFTIREESVRSLLYALVNTGNIDPALFRIQRENGSALPEKFKEFLQTLSAKNNLIAGIRRNMELLKKNFNTLEKNHERTRKTLNSNVSGSYRNTLNLRLAELDKKMDSLQTAIDNEEKKLKKSQEDLQKFLQNARFF